MNRPQPMMGTPSYETPPAFRQLGILVLDGSGSMEEPCEGNQTKAEVTGQAAAELFRRLVQSQERSNFWGAVVTFDTEARTLLAPARVTDIMARLEAGLSLNPQQDQRGGTFLGAGLAEAERIAQQFFSNGSPELYSSCVVVLMSDGRDREELIAAGQNPDLTESVRIAERLRKMPDVILCTTYLASPAHPDDVEAQNALRQIATPSTEAGAESKFYTTSRNANDLRAFFERSLRAAQ
jgi:Mg-chelatase subunit ChlD